MKINYAKIKGRAIVPIDQYNLQEIILAFVKDGKLPITDDYIYGHDMELYNKWCFFGNQVRRSQKKYNKNFAIALEENSLEGCVYGDVSELLKLGYEPISLTDSLLELPNLCNILGVTPNQFLEVKGLLENSIFSPHRISLDGVIRSKNDGCLGIDEVLELLKKVGDGKNTLYDLFDLDLGDCFKIEDSDYGILNNLDELLEKCKFNHGLIYELLNDPSMVQKVMVLEDDAEKKL